MPRVEAQRSQQLVDPVALADAASTSQYSTIFGAALESNAIAGSGRRRRGSTLAVVDGVDGDDGEAGGAGMHPSEHDDAVRAIAGAAAVAQQEAGPVARSKVQARVGTPCRSSRSSRTQMTV